MLAVAYSSLDAYVQAPHLEFVLDLSGASLLKVLDEFVSYKKIKKHRGIYNGLISHLKKYPSLMPIQITDIFWKLFLELLLSENLKPSTVEEYCYQLKAALNWGSKHGCLLSPTFSDFDKMSYKSPKVALTPDLISHIYHFKLDSIKCRSDHRKNLERVRDMFVLACSLGQRYSDMKRITRDNFIDDHTLKILLLKTANIAIVDIEKFAIDKKVALDILKKYDYCTPYSRDISNYNKMLKELLSIIGEEFTDTISLEYHDGEKIVKLTFTRRSKISSHTARRTFVINNIKSYTDKEIMKATGHKDIRTLDIYKIDKI